MDEKEPVDDGEFVLRRIHRSFFDAGLPTPVRFAAFRPNANDTTGLSFFRARFVQPVDTLANLDPIKARDYYVARLSVQAMRKLGLNVVPDPIEDGPLGHAIVPELSVLAYQSRKQNMKPILVELAKLASADIVHTAS